MTLNAVMHLVGLGAPARAEFYVRKEVRISRCCISLVNKQERKE